MINKDEFKELEVKFETIKSIRRGLTNVLLNVTQALILSENFPYMMGSSEASEVFAGSLDSAYNILELSIKDFNCLIGDLEENIEEFGDLEDEDL